MYDFSGYLEYGVNRIFNNTVYLSTKENDIIALNMKTGNIEAITTDHRSVNPYLSPHGRYLLLISRMSIGQSMIQSIRQKKLCLIYVGMLYQMNIHFMVMIILLLMVMIIRL